jgi:hypothetical protein
MEALRMRDGELGAAEVRERIRQLDEADRPRYRRLWAYYRNPMSLWAIRTDESGSERPYRQAQEWGLPPRITGLRAGREIGSGDPAGGVRRKEVVIENDIAWRVETMVDYLFGRPIVISSTAPDAQRRSRIEQLLRAADSHLDFDLDLAKSQSNDNPVYYVQYAHARICSILRQAVAQGAEVRRAFKVNFALLDNPAEYDLMRKIADLPGVVKTAAETLEPHRLTHYAMELAGAFHKFYAECRVLGEEDAKQAARIVLINVTRIALRNVLELIGVEAPERM